MTAINRRGWPIDAPQRFAFASDISASRRPDSAAGQCGPACRAAGGGAGGFVADGLFLRDGGPALCAARAPGQGRGSGTPSAAAPVPPLHLLSLVPLLPPGVLRLPSFTVTAACVCVIPAGSSLDY